MRGYFLSGLIQRILILKGKRSLVAIEKNSHDAMGINQKRLMEILRKNQNTEYGKNIILIKSTLWRTISNRSFSRNTIHMSRILKE